MLVCGSVFLRALYNYYLQPCDWDLTETFNVTLFTCKRLHTSRCDIEVLGYIWDNLHISLNKYCVCSTAACNVSCFIRDIIMVAWNLCLLHAYVYDTLEIDLGYLCELIYIHSCGVQRVSKYLYNNTYYWLSSTP